MSLFINTCKTFNKINKITGDISIGPKSGRILLIGDNKG